MRMMTMMTTTTMMKNMKLDQKVKRKKTKMISDMSI